MHGLRKRDNAHRELRAFAAMPAENPARPVAGKEGACRSSGTSADPLRAMRGEEWAVMGPRRWSRGRRVDRRSSAPTVGAVFPLCRNGCDFHDRISHMLIGGPDGEGLFDPHKRVYYPVMQATMPHVQPSEVYRYPLASNARRRVGSIRRRQCSAITRGAAGKGRGSRWGSSCCRFDHGPRLQAGGSVQ